MLSNVIDISILAVLVMALVCGAYKGAIRQIASLCGVVFGIIAGRLFCDAVGAWMLQQFNLPAYLFPAIPFTLVFVGVLVACLLAGKLLREFFSAAGAGWFDRCAGAGFAVGKWVLIISVLLNIVELTGVFNTNETYVERKKQSLLYEPVKNTAPQFFPYIPITIEYAKKQFSQ